MPSLALGFPKLEYDKMTFPRLMTTNISAIYSTRKVNPDYTGYCMKVRRSTDNKTMDIGFVNGSLDTTSLLNFVSIGNSGYVDTWYDQSGNGRYSNQANINYQPAIVTNGVILTIGGKPIIYFNQTSGYKGLTVASGMGIGLNEARTLIFAAKTGASGRADDEIFGTNTITMVDIVDCVRIRYKSDIDRNLATPAGSWGVNQAKICTVSYNGTSTIVNLNGVNQTLTNPDNCQFSYPLTDPVGIGWALFTLGENRGFNGYLGEIIILNNDLNIQLIESNMNTHYSVF